MIISMLPVCLLLLHCVTSADFSTNKRVPRMNTRVIRTHDANHPPILESNDEIPVAVVYDDEEVIKVRNNKHEKKADVEGELKYLEYKTSGGEAINLEIPPVNHPPSRGLQPFAGVDDYEGQLNIKPRSRSIKIPETESDATKADEQPTNESKTRTGIRSRKRVQKVRKLKVDKSQLNAYVSESAMAENKEAEKEAKTTTDKTRSDAPSVPTPRTFKPRKGLPDPVVPIIELESYVYSHSGNFHYSYEGGDGTKAYERGVQKSFNGGSGSAVEGNYSYKDKDGNDVSLTYTADENGYRPVGAHLPTPPPIPPAIQRALAYLATKTTPEPITERIKTL